MMGKKFKSALLATSLFAGVAISYMPADAEACGCLPPAYASTVATSTGAISAGFGMLTLMISQSFGAINASLSAQQSTMAEVTSYQNSEYTQLARMEARHQVVTDFTSGVDACVSGYDASTRTGPKSLGSLQVRRQLSEANDMHLRNLTTTTSGTAAANATATLEEMESRYCGLRSEMLGRCTFAESEVSDRPELRDAHIKPLLMQYDTLDDQLARAANDFAQIVAGPTPPPPVGQDYATPLGQVKLRDRVTRDARVDTMMETFEYLTGLKKEVGEEDAVWADNLREHVTGSSDPNINGGNPHADSQSLYEVMALQNEFRFKSPDWVNGIMAGTPSELPILKELAVMEATNLYTEWKRFELDQRIASNLAVILATKAEESYVRTE
ncbi:MAG: hypothetical protein KI792_03655 [Alphaproteobacteria bacterium]|nr:hypothetical protein [Alphaproteobacteria bacterium SS10]